MTTPIFLHGLDSSGQGTKGTFLAEHFSQIRCPDFTGSLEERLQQLDSICQGLDDLIFVGSSFGGLMATCFAIGAPELVHRLVLLAPALNFEGYTPPPHPVSTETLLVIGKNDVVTPPHLVIPLAEKTFSNLEVILADDDHMLHGTFKKLDWKSLI